MGRPPQHAARDTRGALLGAALDLFAQRGYSGASIRAITRAAGVSESLLYRHFANKRAIFNAVLNEAEAGAAAGRFDTDGAADRDPRTIVQQEMERVLRAWDTRRGRLVCGLLACELSDATPERLSATFASAGELRDLFASWMNDGRMRADLGAAPQLVWELLSPIAYIRLLYLRPDAKPHVRQAGRELALRHVAYFAATVFPGLTDPAPRLSGATLPRERANQRGFTDDADSRIRSRNIPPCP